MRVIRDTLYIKEFNELFVIKEKSRKIINARTTLSSRNHAKHPFELMVFFSGYNCCGARESGYEHTMRDEPNVIHRGLQETPMTAITWEHLTEQNFKISLQSKEIGQV